MKNIITKNIAQTGIIEVNEDLEIEYIDPALKYYFKEPEQWTGKKVTDIPELKKCDLNDFIQKLSSGQSVKKKIHLSAGKEQKEVLIEGEPLIKQPGIYKKAAILIQDITPLLKKWDAFNLSMESYKSITDSIPSGIIVTDKNGWILFSNPVAGKILETVFNRKRKIPASLRMSEGPTQKITYTTPEKITFHFDVTVTKTNWFGKPAFLHVLHDITSLKKTEDQNILLLTAIQSSTSGIVITNQNMVIDWINPAFTNLTGWSIEDAIGRKVPELMNIKGETESSFISNAKDSIAKTEIFRTQIRRPRKDGTYFECELTVTPFYDRMTHLKRYVFVFNDLTERKEKENIILTLNNVFESLGKASSIEESFRIFKDELLKNKFHTIIYLMDADKKAIIPRYFSMDEKILKEFESLADRRFDTLKIPVRGISEKYEKILQKRQTVFSGNVAGDLQKILPMLPTKTVRQLIRRFKMQHSISAPLIDREGGVFAIFQLLSDRLTENNVPDIIAFANHLSLFLQRTRLVEDLKKNYDKLQVSLAKTQAGEKKYKDLFDHDLTGDYISTPEGKFLDCNQAFVEILGYNSKKEILSLNPSVLYPDIKERKKIFESLKKNKKIINQEEELIRKDGKRIYVLLNAYGVFDKQAQLIKNIGYIFDITKRKQYEAELIRAKEKAEESNLLKTAFLTNMSHEIRTPLNAIMGFAELLNDPAISQDEKDNYVRIIKSSGRHLLHILQEILYISRIEAHEIIIRKEPFDLHSLLNELRIMYEKDHLLLKKQLTIKTVNNLNTPYILKSDRERLREILQNLINNAIKFTGKGSISFGYREKNDNLLEFYVEDTGMGIAKKDLSRIFNRFQQADDSLTRLHEGIGLGLSISRELVKLLGGDIRVVSNPGKGSVFYFTLPKK